MCQTYSRQPITWRTKPSTLLSGSGSPSAPSRASALGRAHELQRVEQPEVQRRGEQRVRQPPVAGQHRVLVRAEGRQPVVEEVRQRAQRLGAGDGEQPRAVDPDERDLAGRSQRSRSARTSSSISSSSGHHGSGTGTRAVGGRRLAVVVVEVPAAADRVGAVHQHAVAPAAVAVEVLHQQPAGRTGVPRATRVPAQAANSSCVFTKPRAASTCDARTAARTRSRLRQVVGAQTDSGSAHRSQRLARRCAPGGGRLLAQLGGAVAQRREHEVGLLPVEAAAGEHRLRLDEQHRLVGVVEEVRAELVGEQPPPCGGGPLGEDGEGRVTVGPRRTQPLVPVPDRRITRPHLPAAILGVPIR